MYIQKWIAGLFCIVIVCAFCQCKVGSASRSKGISVLLVGGGSSHDFNRWYKQGDVTTLEQNNFASVTYTDNTDSIQYYLPNTDVLFLSNNQPISSAASRQAIVNHINAGKGVVVAHAALWYNWSDWPEYNLQIAGGGSKGHNRYGSFDVTILDSLHPVTKGVSTKFSLKDELYYYIPDTAGPGIEVLANASSAVNDKIHPSVFVIKNPKARIVGIALGHDGDAHDFSPYQTFLRNSIRWVARK